MKRSCFLFGHADTPHSVLPILEKTIEDEILKGVTEFYVGYHGNFDRMAAAALKAAKSRHAEIVILLLLAYHPSQRTIEVPQGFDGTFYPPIEKVPHRYAVVRANQYMVKKADRLICYVRYPGNARKLMEYAKKNHFREGSIINIAEQMKDRNNFAGNGIEE